MQSVTVRALCIIFSTILARSSRATSIDARVIEVVPMLSTTIVA